MTPEAESGGRGACKCGDGEGEFDPADDPRQRGPAERVQERVCVVCFECRRSTMLPCGHQVLCVDCANLLLNRESPCPTCRTPFDSFVVGTMLGRKNSFDRDQPHSHILNPPTLPLPPAPANSLHEDDARDAADTLRCVSSTCCLCVPLPAAHRFICVCDVLWALAAFLVALEDVVTGTSPPAASVVMLILKVAVASLAVLSYFSRTPQARKENKLRHYKLWGVRVMFALLVAILTMSLGADRMGAQVEWETQTGCTPDKPDDSSNGRSSTYTIEDSCGGDFDDVTVGLLMILSPIVTDAIFLLLPGVVVEAYLLKVLRACVLTVHEPSNRSRAAPPIAANDLL